MEPSVRERLGRAWGHLPYHPGQWRIAYALAGRLSGSRTARVDGFQLTVAVESHLGRNLYLVGEHERWEWYHLRRLVRPDDIVLDVGANIGYHCLLFSRLARQVVAVEPEPANYAALLGALARNKVGNVTAYRIALSDRGGECGLANPGSDSGSFHLAAGRGVEQARLDDWWPQSHGRLDVAKVDIEGAELMFLAGGRRTLSTVRVLMIEYYPDALAVFGGCGEDLERALRAVGFRLYVPRRTELAPFAHRPLRGDHINILALRS